MSSILHVTLSSRTRSFASSVLRLKLVIYYSLLYCSLILWTASPPDWNGSTSDGTMYLLYGTSVCCWIHQLPSLRPSLYSKASLRLFIIICIRSSWSLLLLASATFYANIIATVSCLIASAGLCVQ